MRRASEIKRAGSFAAQETNDCVRLASEDRHRRRIVLTTERGTEFLLDLPHPVVLKHGDGLVFDDGSLVSVVAEPEALVEVKAATSQNLLRLAWHLGNRHTPLEVAGMRLRIRRDHVLETMLGGLGAQLTPIEAAFNPEGGVQAHDHVDDSKDDDHHHSEFHPPRRAARDDPQATGEGVPESAARCEKTNPIAPAGALYRLLTWLSPGYPVGAFSYSGGLEWAVERGDVTNAEALRSWLTVLLSRGAFFCDAVLFAHAHRAGRARDNRGLRTVAELAAAFAPSRERHVETTAQGAAFLSVTRAAWPCSGLDDLAAAWSGPYAYPVAVGVTAAGHGIAVEPALIAFLQALAQNCVSAGVRLIPLGQTAGQCLMARIEPLLHTSAHRALALGLDEMGSAAFRADLATQKHETQYTRLFRS